MGPTLSMHYGGTIWITGIPESGKTTLARCVAKRITSAGGRVEILDGDEVRRSISSGLGYSREDRAENVSRLVWVAERLVRNGTWVIVSVVSPYKSDRAFARAALSTNKNAFIEVFVKCPLSVAIARDSKGLYKKAAEGSLKGVTGIDDPYEEPNTPDVILDSGREAAEVGAQRVIERLMYDFKLNPPVVCIGRGFGGTRLVSLMLQDLGIFIGRGNNVNGCEDSMEWTDLVYEMVRDTEGSKEFPTGSKYKSRIIDTAQRILAGGGIAPGHPWGWKLPETTQVLPSFVEAFPQMKVIHCIRHPISASLRDSHVTSSLETYLGKWSLPGAYSYCKRDISKMNGDPFWIRNAIAWNHHVTRAMYYGRTMLDRSKYMEVRYEDMRKESEKVYEALERFTELKRVRVRPSVVFDERRSNAWDLEDPRAKEVWLICGKTAELLGYTQFN